MAELPVFIAFTGIDRAEDINALQALSARYPIEWGLVDDAQTDKPLSYEAIYRSSQNVDGCCLHDVAAAAWLVNRSLFETQTGPVRVVTDGIAIGQTVQKPDKQNFGPSGWDNYPSQTICVAAGNGRLIAAYMQAIRSDVGQR